MKGKVERKGERSSDLIGGRKKETATSSEEGKRNIGKHKPSTRTSETQIILFFSVGHWKSGKRLSCLNVAAFFVCVNMIYYIG